VVLVLLGFVLGCLATQWHYEGHRLSLRYNAVTDSSTFGYEGDLGPQFWADLNPDWALCATGHTQSPVSLNESYATTTNKFNLQLFWEDLVPPVTLLNNGHTFEIEVNDNSKGKNSYLMFNGARYDLMQFHFHQNAEHHVFQYSAPLELHLVHQSDDGTGSLLVVGVFLDRDPLRHRNRFLNQFWDQIPLNESTVQSNLFIRWNPLLNLLDLNQYWTYMGSLTTPPCTEGVRFVILKEAVPISFEQWANYTAILGFNARYTQPLFGRRI